MIKKYLMCLICLFSIVGCNEKSASKENNSILDPLLEPEIQVVTDAAVDAKKSQIFYLWKNNNMPIVTKYTTNNAGYYDDPDFRPNIIFYPVKEGIEIKGAVLICAGGAFQFRSNDNEGFPVAKALSELGYQSFVVNYRLRPYSQQEGVLDLARAVRFVKKSANDFQIDENNIAVMGFSAGGILCGEMLLNYDGLVNGSFIDDNYHADYLDEVPIDVSAVGMIYSFYGRLSVASTDIQKFSNSDLPPTYFCYGTEDPFVEEFEKCIVALKKADVSIEKNVLQNMPHGYGTGGHWISDFDQWLMNTFKHKN